ncbi:MAG: hypothetical protein K0R09_2549 [Clostridiales bacterium]|jgi:signal transduction histidine kinase|nr:hypothetical protein [Clostridiales bacterium]
MEIIIDTIKNYEAIFVLALFIAVVILLLIETINRVEINRLEKRYKKMMKGSYGKSIEELLVDYTGKVEESMKTVKEIDANFKSIDMRVKSSLQKCSVVRFRAFDDVGSDLSFSIALLDEKNDGVILTGIYGRNECATFAKPIENGISKYDLSEEEKQAIKNAINGK